MYKVFESSYQKDGKITIKGKDVDNFKIIFTEVGTAKGFADAKKKYKMKLPVLQEII